MSPVGDITIYEVSYSAPIALPQLPTAFVIRAIAYLLIRSSPSDTQEFADASMAHSWLPSRTFIASKKVSSTLQLPCPSFLRGGFLFLSFSFHNRIMNILQEIFTDHYEEIKYTLHPDLLRWKISIRWSTVVILLMVVPCMAVSTAEISSLFLSVVTAVSALPAVINIPWIALPLCPLSSLMSTTPSLRFYHWCVPPWFFPAGSLSP